MVISLHQFLHKNQRDISYVNLTNANQEEFVNNFNNKYSAKKKITSSYPALVVLDNGKISDIIQHTIAKN